MKNRRAFLKKTAWSAAAIGLQATTGGLLLNACSVNKKEVQQAGLAAGAGQGGPSLKISLAEWSVREKLRSGELDNLGFPAYARQQFDIGAVEYVNSFFFEKATDTAYLNELKLRSSDAGVNNVLIMIDKEGPLADPYAAVRNKAVENHYKWIEAAAHLGCHAVRVNAYYSNGSYQDTGKAFVESMNKLGEFAATEKITVLMENHGGFSSNGYWIREVFEQLDSERFGTLPDFGNFTINREEGLMFDPLAGLSFMMPFAKGVSAKAHNFDAEGNETTIDFPRMMQIVKAAGFSGYTGIEWGGNGYQPRLTADEGIMATKKLLQKLGAGLLA